MFELTNRSHPAAEMSISQHMEDARKMKETLCKVAIDFDAEMKTAVESANIEKVYTLPNSK